MHPKIDARVRDRGCEHERRERELGNRPGKSRGTGEARRGVSRRERRAPGLGDERPEGGARAVNSLLDPVRGQTGDEVRGGHEQEDVQASDEEGREQRRDEEDGA